MVQEIARGTRGDMILKGPLIDLAIGIGGSDREHDAARSLSKQETVALTADVGTA